MAKSKKDVFAPPTEDELTMFAPPSEEEMAEEVPTPPSEGETTTPDDGEASMLDYLRLAGHGLTQGLSDEAAGLGAWLGAKSGDSGSMEVPLSGKALEQFEKDWGEDAPESFVEETEDEAYREGKAERKAEIEESREKTGMLGALAEGVGGMAVPGMGISRLTKAGKLGAFLDPGKTVATAAMKGVASGAASGAAYGLTEGEADIFTKGELADAMKEVAESAAVGGVLGGLGGGLVRGAGSVKRAIGKQVDASEPGLMKLMYDMGRKGETASAKKLRSQIRDKSLQLYNKLDNSLNKNSDILKKAEGQTKISVKKNLLSLINRLKNADVYPDQAGQRTVVIDRIQHLLKTFEGKWDNMNAAEANKIRTAFADLIYDGIDSPAAITNRNLNSAVRGFERELQEHITKAVDAQIKKPGFRQAHLNKVAQNLELRKYLGLPEKVGKVGTSTHLKKTDRIMSMVEATGRVGTHKQDAVVKVLGKIDPSAVELFTDINGKLAPMRKMLELVDDPSSAVNTLARHIVNPVTHVKHKIVDRMANLMGLGVKGMADNVKVFADGIKKITPKDLQELAMVAASKGYKGLSTALTTVAGKSGSARTAQIYALSRQPGFQAFMGQMSGIKEDKKQE